jgi:hypothetical protein
MPNSPYLKIVQVDFSEAGTLVYMQYSNFESTEAICISRAAYIEAGRTKYRLLNSRNQPVCGESTLEERSNYNFVLEFKKMPVAEEFDIVEPIGWFNIFGIEINLKEKSNLLDAVSFSAVTMAEAALQKRQISVSSNAPDRSAMRGVKKNRRGYIGLSAGLSFPNGDFASNSMTNPNAGFAKSGLYISLAEFGVLFSRRVGIVGRLFGAQYEIDHEEFEEPWAMGGLMLGPLFAIPLNNAAYWDFRPAVGYGAVILPESSFAASSTSETYVMGLGTSLRVNVGSRFAIMVAVDYIYTNPEFEVEVEVEKYVPYPTITTLDQKINVVSVSLGIACTW